MDLSIEQWLSGSVVRILDLWPSFNSWLVC